MVLVSFDQRNQKKGETINAKKIAISLFGVLMLTGLLATTVNAGIWPYLPPTSTVVQLTVVDDTTSYFISTLSGVPAGFDVTNGVYPGWCIDRSTDMIRSSPHDVVLYSSLSPPAVLSGIDFDAINYILNNKQGIMMDVQQAIWFFTGEFVYGDLSTEGKAMVDAANAATTFDPTIAPILAVICLPQEDPDAQNSIIEITRSGCGLSPGFWKHNLGVYLGLRNGSYSDPEGSLVVSKGNMAEWLAELDANPGLDLPGLYDDLNTKGGGAAGAMARVGAANIFNALAGLLSYSD